MIGTSVRGIRVGKRPKTTEPALEQSCPTVGEGIGEAETYVDPGGWKFLSWPLRVGRLRLVRRIYAVPHSQKIVSPVMETSLKWVNRGRSAGRGVRHKT